MYLLRLLPEYQSSPLVRTRDPAVLDTCHTVVDVGGEYDRARNRFDHHQRQFNTVFPHHDTKLSSAGLIYLHYGKAIIAQHAKLPTDHSDVEFLFRKLYDDFVEALDANDNGIAKYDPAKLEAAGVEPRFKDGGISLASLVGDLNYEDPLNKSTPKSDPDETQAEEDYRFGQASSLVGMAFLRKLHDAVSAWLPARATVKAAIDTRSEVHPLGRIMILPKAGIPWKSHLYDFEESMGIPEDNKVYYVLYPEKEDPSSKWRVQAVSKNLTSFESRKALPENWRGLRDAELDQVLGETVENGAVFVHASGFIGGHKTEAGVKAMATKAMEM